MANKRQLKKQINGVLAEIIEEYYNALINNKDLKEEKIEALVDECADLANELVAKINSSKKLKSRAEVKKLFAEVKEKLGDKLVGFTDKVDNL